MFKRSLVHRFTPMLFAGWLACCSVAQAHAQMGSSEKPAGSFLGLDRNLYPGDQVLPTIAKRFAFVGYWLNNPPGMQSNGWQGKRTLIKSQNLGFLVLWNGRLDKEILAKAKRGTSAVALGKADAHDAIQAALREGFPSGATLFLDQEEGGRLLAEQADYLFAWTEAVSAGGFRAGAYVSGQPVSDGPGKTITTAQNVREVVAAKHLHPIALFVAQDSCPPSNGCTVTPPPMAASGTPGAIAWQYSQSPRRPAITRACMKTYASDGNCYVPELPGMLLDLDVAAERDPSHGR
ncbi:protein of unknown function (DUF1906) [Terriglobus roseus DSM 18391]|uniref:Rv2525c-like glycoside hydrolase-like domain-containing protein n=1 Tax=Terriglobus roseus (strain DSM 18391 / NRRL B-41598 / KBS 63) TaxID=926566 RepID=I3ZL28_TERRK|nr:glycoside hydrolase domain-containing protein [Terriglobus roseus]AFL89946.1 protein of unknown function (DUF1906) [Terriglobus roseus DSM 18391]